jgi:hypothetical protein
LDISAIQTNFKKYAQLLNSIVPKPKKIISILGNIPEIFLPLLVETSKSKPGYIPERFSE